MGLFDSIKRGADKFFDVKPKSPKQVASTLQNAGTNVINNTLTNHGMPTSTGLFPGFVPANLDPSFQNNATANNKGTQLTKPIWGSAGGGGKSPVGISGSQVAGNTQQNIPSFKTGGRVRAPKNKPILAIVHGGETILPSSVKPTKKQMGQIAKLKKASAPR